MKNIYSYSIRRRNGWGNGFGPRPTHCAQCGCKILVMKDNGATGYGSLDEERLGAGALLALSEVCTLPEVKAGEYLTRSRAICYACCGENDKKSMIETGRATLYLSYMGAAGMSLRGRSSYPMGAYADGEVTNWPGSLRFKARVKPGRHNIARVRFDAWFTGPDGKTWHAVSYGDNSQIAHARRCKG